MNHLVKPCRALWRFKAINGPPASRFIAITSAACSDFKQSEELAKERYDIRANEDDAKKRARLLYQSRKRGMLENGVLLASFADKYLNQLDPEQLDQYDRLINLPTNDWDIFYWATKTKPTPVEFETPVMQKLREHIKSKVSSQVEGNEDKEDRGYNEGKKVVKSILDGKRLDDIVMPATKRKFDLNPDYSGVSVTDYDKQLFDQRVDKLPGGYRISKMTEWRKNYFIKRLRRTISSPVSLRNLSDEQKAEAFTQKTTTAESIARKTILQTHLVDTNCERTYKHHNFLQHLMSSKFTDNAIDYDDEAEAWANTIWHRNYGSADVTVAPSSNKCSSCHAKLHCCDPGLIGYVPRELFASLEDNQKCQRCKFTQMYDAALDITVSNEDYVEMIWELRKLRSSIVCLLVDLTDFPSSIWPGIRNLVGNQHKTIVIGNKLDLLPYDGSRMIERVTNSMVAQLNRIRPDNQNLNIQDVMVMSARTGFGVEALVTRIMSLSIEPKNVYLVGCSNTGKSTLFNALLQSDLSAIRKGDLLSRVSEFQWPESKYKLLKFPIYQAEGWEIELKKKRLVRTERNTFVRERSLQGTTVNRQATMPHMSMLIDRTEYLPKTTITTTTSSTLLTQEDSDERLKLSEDHPLRTLVEVDNEPLSGGLGDEFSGHRFFYQTPSTIHRDQLHDLLTIEERLEVFPHETMIPRKYALRPLQSIFIAGLARLDLLTSTSYVNVTIFASRYLPVHVIPTRKADQFYCTFLGSSYLGVPHGDRQRLKAWPKLKNSQTDYHIKSSSSSIGTADIVMSSIGWGLVSLTEDHECIFRAFTPDGRGISLRDPPLLARANRMSGRKIRDTPVFEHPHYSIERVAT